MFRNTEGVLGESGFRVFDLLGETIVLDSFSSTENTYIDRRTGVNPSNSIGCLDRRLDGSYLVDTVVRCVTHGFL